MTDPYSLSAADVADLRASMRQRPVDSEDPSGVHRIPYITYLPADDAWLLHAYGHLQAVSPRIDVLAACLRCERAERGFIARILDTSEDVRLASLQPDLAAAERRRQAEERLRAQRQQDTERAALERRRALLGPTNILGIELDDLLG